MELLFIQSERAMTLTEMAIAPAIIDFFNIHHEVKKSIRAFTRPLLAELSRVPKVHELSPLCTASLLHGLKPGVAR
jgi:hypothetical protein